MDNPFSFIDRRLTTIENLLLEIRHVPVKLPPVPDEAVPLFVSKKEAARLLSVCPSTIDNYARQNDGKLKRHYIGKSVRFDRSQVLSLAKSHTNHKQKHSKNEY